MPNIKFDWNELTGKVSDILLEGLQELTEENADELALAASIIAPNLLQAAINGDELMELSLIAQLTSIMEINRISLEKNTYDLIRQIGGTIVKTISVGLTVVGGF